MSYWNASKKNHTSKRGAFQTIGDNPAFIIAENQIQKNMSEEFFKINEYQPKIKVDTKIALVKYHPGYDPKQIDQIIEMGYKGIIFEGTGIRTYRKNNVSISQKCT